MSSWLTLMQRSRDGAGRRAGGGVCVTARAAVEPGERVLGAVQGGRRLALSWLRPHNEACWKRESTLRLFPRFGLFRSSHRSDTRHAPRSHPCPDAVVLRWPWVLCTCTAGYVAGAHVCLGPQRGDRGARTHERRLGWRAGLLHVLREQARCQYGISLTC